MKNDNLTLTIGHLYPDLMDTYGDRGNIIAITKRCQWRDIAVHYTSLSLDTPWDLANIDFLFFGGGQDRAQTIVAQDLGQGKGEMLKDAVNRGSVLLAVCGGYQLLGKSYQPHHEPEIPGVGLFDAYTVAGEKRMIGNLIIEIQNDSLSTTNPTPKTIVGFENHSGKTYLGKNCQPLGSVLLGSGNNGEDGTEGARQQTAFGCYLHGSLLPKNPHLADYLIALALKRRYGEINLTPLDDTLEWQAHHAAIARAREISGA